MLNFSILFLLVIILALNTYCKKINETMNLDVYKT